MKSVDSRRARRNNWFVGLDESILQDSYLVHKWAFIPLPLHDYWSRSWTERRCILTSLCRFSLSAMAEMGKLCWNEATNTDSLPLLLSPTTQPEILKTTFEPWATITPCPLHSSVRFIATHLLKAVPNSDSSFHSHARNEFLAGR